MAQTGYTPISIYYSATATNTPTAGNLVAGELAINTNDGVLYYKDSSGVVQSIASKAGNSGSFTNLAYTGTLTGGTGVVNLGSGQFYKDASGNVGIGTSSPVGKFRVSVLPSYASTNGFMVSNNGIAGQMAATLYFTTGDGTNAQGMQLAPLAGAGLAFRQGSSSPIGSETYTEAMRIDSAGNVGIGTSSPSAKLQVAQTYTSDTTRQVVFSDTTGTSLSFGGTGGGVKWINSENTGGGGAYPLAFQTGGAEAMRIDSSGNLLVGTTTPTGLLTVVGGTTAGTSVQAGFGGVNGTSCRLYHADAGGQSTALTVQSIAKVASSGRSINAAGTINALGTDYAEYMVKNADFTIAKGDIAGIDKNGKLTNVFSDSISFVVKSTSPSYVGGDSWGTGFEDDADGLEKARQTVDRIAFSGQVPVNVLNAIAGQYIIPINDNGSIKGEAVSNPTFEQYQIAVGKVIAIEADGRARIIVKVS